MSILSLLFLYFPHYQHKALPQALHSLMYELSNWLFSTCIVDIGSMYGLILNSKNIYHLKEMLNDYYYFVDLLLVVFYLLRFCVGFLKFSIGAFSLLVSYYYFSCTLAVDEQRVAWLRAFCLSSFIATLLASQMAFCSVWSITTYLDLLF